VRNSFPSTYFPSIETNQWPLPHIFACLRICLYTPFSVLSGYHKNILIKFHIYAHDILLPSAGQTRQTFNCDRNTGIKRSPLIIQITHTSSLPTALKVPLQFALPPALGPFLSTENLGNGLQKNERKILWNYSMRAVSISFRRFTASVNR